MTPSGLIRWALRRVTAPVRGLPDFIVIGAPRSGTTTLYRALSRHTRVIAASNQEVHFFNRTPTYERGLVYYRSFFPLEIALTRRQAITGEGTSVYMYRPNTAERISADLPDVRLIALLRDPVERAIESWTAFTERGEEERPLLEALTDEITRLGSGDLVPPAPGEVPEGTHDPAHVQKGRYADQLRRWMERFDDTRMLTLFSEDLFSKPEEVLASVLEFLGLPPETIGIDRPTATADPPEGAEARALLESYYEAPNRELSELLGRPLPWG